MGNFFALVQAGCTQPGNLNTMTLSSIRRRARRHGIGARWRRNSLGNYQFSIFDMQYRGEIDIAYDDDDLRETLIGLIQEAETEEIDAPALQKESAGVSSRFSTHASEF